MTLVLFARLVSQRVSPSDTVHSYFDERFTLLFGGLTGTGMSTRAAVVAGMTAVTVKGEEYTESGRREGYGSTDFKVMRNITGRETETTVMKATGAME